MAEKATSKSSVWVVVLCVIAAAALAIYFRSASHGEAEVRTVAVSYGDLTSTSSANGKVEPVEDYQAHAPAPGVIQKVYVTLNEHVTKGQELIRLDDSEAKKNVAAAEAGVASAQAALQNVRGNGTMDENLAAKNDMAAARLQVQQLTTRLSSTQALAAKGSASANEVEAVRQQLADAQTKVSQLETRAKGRYSSADISSQQAQLLQAQAQLAAARKAYANVDVRAPFSGTIYSLPVGDLDFVKGEDVLLNMANLSQMQVRGYFDEPEIGRLADGQPVKIVWEAKPNLAWYGHIKQAPTTIISYGTRNVGECLISVDDARGDLLPNTNVTIKVTTSQKKGVLSLPREALHTDGSKNFVYRIVGGKLQKIPVQVGGLNLISVEITSGLKDGDVVVLNVLGNSELRDGLAVKVVQ